MSMDLPIPEWEATRDQVWKDREQRRKRRSCARCGTYYKHSIIESTRPVHIDDYEGDQHFYKISYELQTDKIVSDQNVTDAFYDLCDKCIAHGKGLKPYELPANKEEIERELSRLKKIENKRRWAQEEQITKARAEVVKARKEKAEAEPVSPLEKLGNLVRGGGHRRGAKSKDRKYTEEEIERISRDQE